MPTSLENLRHSLAHLLAAAVLELYPDAKRAIGPAIENGFYYDFEFPRFAEASGESGSRSVSDDDLPKIEKKMREILSTWNKFERSEVTPEEARKLFKDNPYKLELIEEYKNQELTLYTSGDYIDLCRGGHVENAGDIQPDAFKLTHVAGAYWRGSEKNKQLTRIYGVAFATKKELDEYLTMMQEAKTRDHKKLGPELDLFIFSDLVGAGLPLFTPKGTLVRNLLDNFVWDLRKKAGYQQVDIPHLTKKELYETSGHWDKFKDDLYRITTREKHEFAIKPMNCPHHIQIYARRPWSYRELPQRYASTTKVYRDEQSGEVAGLTRVRSITQDDAHVFCRMSQAQEEFMKIWDIVENFYGAFDINLRVRLSLHDPAHPEKYLGDPKKWQEAERMLREIAQQKSIESFDGMGEAAFYGPKLDFLGKDAIGREHQVATIQLDLNQPERFDLVCINESGQKERIVMIHAAIMGSIERFMSVAIEHYAGAFPLWLTPVQVALLPISDNQNSYAAEVAQELSQNDIRIEINTDNETIGKKIRSAELMKIPYLLILGDRELKAEKVAVRQRGQGDLGQMDLNSFLARLKKEIAGKK